MRPTLVVVTTALIAFSIAAPVRGQVAAQLRAASGYPAGHFIGPSTPGGGIVEGHHFWGCDGLQSFIRYEPADPNNPDPVNSGILVTSSSQLSTIMTKCAQAAFDGNNTVFVADNENGKGTRRNRHPRRRQAAGIQPGY